MMLKTTMAIMMIKIKVMMGDDGVDDEGDAHGRRWKRQGAEEGRTLGVESENLPTEGGGKQPSQGTSKNVTTGDGPP